MEKSHVKMLPRDFVRGSSAWLRCVSVPAYAVSAYPTPPDSARHRFHGVTIHLTLKRQGRKLAELGRNSFDFMQIAGDFSLAYLKPEGCRWLAEPGRRPC